MRKWAAMILGDPAEMTTRWYQADAVLSYCRMAETLITAEVHSKRHGTAWGRMMIDSRWRKLIDDAEAERMRPLAELLVPADAGVLTETKAFVEYVLTAHT